MTVETVVSAISSTLLKTPAKKRTNVGSSPEVRATVEAVIDDVRVRGDAAVREYSRKFDNYDPESFLLTQEQLSAILARVPDQVIDDIKFVQEQIRHMAQKQLESLTSFEIETLPGVHLGQKNVPVQSAGVYVPGGKYPMLASAHMTIVTAKVAGVERVVACTPLIHGEVPDATIAAMALGGADEIYLLGGIQAIAAMALGTETMKPVNMLAGPGNAFVAEAKRQLFGEVGIDLFAGPTEVLIIADDHADPFIVAVDLLSQAEHGPDSPAVLITTNSDLGRQVIEHIDNLLIDMPTREYAAAAWHDRGAVHIVQSLDEAYALADEYAFEHVQVLTERPRDALAKMHNYGALFLGEQTCVSYGDKVIGTNHVLPTRGAARYTGGLWVGKYIRTVTYQEITNKQSSAFLGELCGRAARVEHFEGHGRSGDVRAAKYRGSELPWSTHRFQK